MMLEVEAITGEEAIEIAKEAGYNLDDAYSPVPCSRDGKVAFIVRGTRSDETKNDPRIREWTDMRFDLFKIAK